MQYPVGLKKEDPHTLSVTWNDGESSAYNVRHLRLSCPCASCVDEWTGEKRLKEADVPQDVRPLRMETIGRYALRIFWSDGHDTGIYPFRKLRTLRDPSDGPDTAKSDGA